MNIDYGNKIFDTRNPLLTTAQPAYNSTQGNANFGGPMGKKASFNFDYQRRAINEDSLIIGQTLPCAIRAAATVQIRPAASPRSPIIRPIALRTHYGVLTRVSIMRSTRTTRWSFATTTRTVVE